MDITLSSDIEKDSISMMHLERLQEIHLLPANGWVGNVYTRNLCRAKRKKF
jgi:hypothetical protein